MWVFVAVLAFVATLCWGERAWADEPTPRARAVEALERAERSDAELDLRAALEAYEEALRIDPSMSKAIRAERRANLLRTHAEGDFAPLAALERVQRSPELASDPRAVDDLVRAAEGFPPGLVRVEVWVFAAEAYDRRLARPDDAARLWRRVADDPRAEPVIARAAIGSLAAQELARGDVAAAEADAMRPLADPALRIVVRRVARRHLLHVAAITAVVVAVLLAAAALVRAGRQRRLADVVVRAKRVTPLTLAYAAYVAVAGGVLAAGYDDGNAAPFLAFGVVLAPLLLLARAWGAAGSSRTGARVGRAAVCAASAVGAGFLVLERVDITYLEGLGL